LKNLGNNQSSVKLANQLLIIKELQKHGILSRSELAKNLSLSNPSISKNIDEMLDIGILVEVGQAITNVGRRPVMLKINSHRGCVASIDFSHSENVKVCLSDLNGKLFEVVKLEGFHTINVSTIDGVTDCLKLLLKKHRRKCGKLFSICIGCPGVIDPNDGKIIYATQIENYASLDLKESFNKIFGVPVIVKNDINLAISGECYYGQGTKHHNVIYVNVDRGLGSGIILNDVLIEGFHGYAGELGQWTVDGYKYKSSNTTFSQTISYRAILKNIQTRFDLGEQTVLRDMVKESSQINFVHIKNAIALNDELCCDEIGKAADVLAWLLVCVNKLLDLELIIIGGIVTEFGDFYLNRIKEELLKCAEYNMADVVFSELNNYAVLYGGVQKAIDCSIELLLIEH